MSERWFFIRYSNDAARGEADTLIATFARSQTPPFRDLIHVEFGYDTAKTRALAEEIKARLEAE